MGLQEWLARRMGVSSQAAAEAVAEAVAKRKALEAVAALPADQTQAIPESIRSAVQAAGSPTTGSGPAIPVAAGWDRASRVTGLPPAGGVRAAIERARAAREARTPFRQLANDIRAAIEAATPVTVEAPPGILQSNQFAALQDPTVQALLSQPDAQNALITIADDLKIPVDGGTDLAGAVIRGVAESAQASARSAARADSASRDPRMGSTNQEAASDLARPELGIDASGQRVGVYAGPETLDPMEASPGVVVSYLPAIHPVTGKPKQAYVIDPATGQPVLDSDGNVVPRIQPGTTNAPTLTPEVAQQIVENGLNYAGIDVAREPVGIFAARTYKTPDGEVVTEPDFDRPVHQLVKRRTGGDGNRSPEAVEFLLPLPDGTFQRLTPGGGGRQEVLGQDEVQRLIYQGFEPQGPGLDWLRPQVESPQAVGRRILEAAMSGGTTGRRTARAILDQYETLRRIGGQEAADAVLAEAGGPDIGQERLQALAQLSQSPATAAERQTAPLLDAIRVNRDIAQPSTVRANAGLPEMSRRATSPQGAAFDIESVGSAGVSRIAEIDAAIADLRAQVAEMPGTPAAGEGGAQTSPARADAARLPPAELISPDRTDRVAVEARGAHSDIARRIADLERERSVLVGLLQPRSYDSISAQLPAASGESVVAGLSASGSPRRNTRAGRAAASTGSVDVASPAGEVFDAAGRESEILANSGIQAGAINNPAQAPELFGDMEFDDELRYDDIRQRFPGLRPLEAYGLMQRFMANPGSWAAGVHPAAANLARMLQETRRVVGARGIEDLPRGLRRSFDNSDPEFGTVSDTGVLPVMTQATVSDAGAGPIVLNPFGPPPMPRPRLAQIIEQSRLRNEAERARTGLVNDARDPASPVVVDDELARARSQEMADEADTSSVLADARATSDPARGWLSAPALRQLFRKAFPGSKNYPLGLQAAEMRNRDMREPSESEVESFNRAAEKEAALRETLNAGVPDEQRNELLRQISEAAKERRAAMRRLSPDLNAPIDGSASAQDRMMQVLLGGGTDRARAGGGGSAAEAYDGDGGFDLAAAVEGRLDGAPAGRSQTRPQTQALSADAALAELLGGEYGDARSVLDNIVRAAGEAGVPLSQEQVIYSMLRNYSGSSELGGGGFSDAALRDLAAAGWQNVQRMSPAAPQPSAVVGEYTTAQKALRGPARLREIIGNFLRPGDIARGAPQPEVAPQDQAWAMLPDPESISPDSAPGAAMPPEMARQAQSQLAAAEQRIAALEQQGLDTTALRDRAQSVRNAIALRLQGELKPAPRGPSGLSQAPGTDLGEGVDAATLDANERVKFEDGVTPEEAAAAEQAVAAKAQELGVPANRVTAELRERAAAEEQAAKNPPAPQQSIARFLEDTLRMGGYLPASGRAYAVDAETANRLRAMEAENRGDIVGRNRDAGQLRDEGDTSKPVIFGVNRKGADLHEIVAARESGSEPVLETLLARPHDPNAPAPQGMEVVWFNDEGVPTFVRNEGTGVRVTDSRGQDTDFDAPRADQIDLRPEAVEARQQQRVAAEPRGLADQGGRPVPAMPVPEAARRARELQAAALEAEEIRAEGRAAQPRPAADEPDPVTAEAEGRSVAQPEVRTEGLAPPTRAADQTAAGRTGEAPATGRRPLLGRATKTALGAVAGAYALNQAQEAGYLPSNRDIVMAALGPQMLAIPGYGGGVALPEDTKQEAEPVVERIRRARRAPFLTSTNFLPY